MERAVGLERTYSLGDYKSLKVSDFVSDIPEELAMNEEFMDGFKSLQVISADRLYYAYAELSDILVNMEGNQERVDYLDEIETNLYTKLVGLMTQENGQEESK